jgi:hypothetical protein
MIWVNRVDPGRLYFSLSREVLYEELIYHLPR